MYQLTQKQYCLCLDLGSICDCHDCGLLCLLLLWWLPLHLRPSQRLQDLRSCGCGLRVSGDGSVCGLGGSGDLPRVEDPGSRHHMSQHHCLPGPCVFVCGGAADRGHGW